MEENKTKSGGDRTQCTMAQLRAFSKLAEDQGNGDLFTYLGFLIQEKQREEQQETPPGLWDLQIASLEKAIAKEVA